MKIEKIKVQEGEFHLYGGSMCLPPGEYFSLPHETKDKKLDRLMGVIHATRGGDYFRLLSLPLDPIPARLLGYEWQEKSTSVMPLVLPDSRDRAWQKDLFSKFNSAASSGIKFRKQINVGLGAGKTYAALRIAAGFSRPVVFCPPHLKQTWKNEAGKFGLKLPEFSTYEGAKKIKFQPDLVILDEVLKVKNPSARRTREVRELCRRADCVLGLTGTPMAGKDWLDLRTLCCVTGAEALPSSEISFKCQLSHETKKVSHGTGSHMEVVSWEEELIHFLIQPYSESVEISDLMKEVPDKRFEKIICSTPAGYQRILWGEGAENRSQAVARARECTDGFVYEKSAGGGDTRNVRGLLSVPKLDELVRQVKRFQEMEPSEPVVIWVNFLASQQKVAQVLREEGVTCSCLFSSMSSEEMGKEQEKFLSGETSVFVCSSSLSEGMNLQERCRVEIFFSNSLSPVKREQAIGRVYRPGQMKQTLIIDLVCANTLDEKLLELLEMHKLQSEKFIQGELEKFLEVENEKE